MPDQCDNCGACCMEQGSPPGYLFILRAGEWPVEEDIERVKRLPEQAAKELIDYGDKLRAGEVSGDGPCIWLTDARRCRWHEHRPSVCRELAVGSPGCVAQREEYGLEETTNA